LRTGINMVKDKAYPGSRFITKVEPLAQ